MQHSKLKIFKILNKVELLIIFKLEENKQEGQKFYFKMQKLYKLLRMI